MKEFWNERFSEKEPAYGNEPNSFLEANFKNLPANGKILCIAEGEGRNALFLARQGYEVTCVDYSEVGITKTLQKAQDQNLKIEGIVADLGDYDLGLNKWDGIVSIFGHLPPELRKSAHKKIIAGLKPNGVFMFELYTIDQIPYGTGGPKDLAMMMSLDIIQEELPKLIPLIMAKVSRDIQEGRYHHGPSATIQYVGMKNS